MTRLRKNVCVCVFSQLFVCRKKHLNKIHTVKFNEIDTKNNRQSDGEILQIMPANHHKN